MAASSSFLKLRKNCTNIKWAELHKEQFGEKPNINIYFHYGDTLIIKKKFK